MTSTQAASRFTWIPIYEELASALVKYRHRQAELVEMVESLRAKGLKVTEVSLPGARGGREPLRWIDPFTFFGIFNRGIKDVGRQAILRELKVAFGLQADVPADFIGIPILNNQNSWFFSRESPDKQDDTDRLWDIFERALETDPLGDPAFAAAFDRALKVSGVSFNLTMGLFWIRPSVFLNLDGIMREKLGFKGGRSGLTFDAYRETCLRVRASDRRPFYEISDEAWSERREPDPSPAQGDPRSAAAQNQAEVQYWLVGAWWESRDPEDQTGRFLSEGVWENGYKDKYLDLVRSMKPGDRIAIKSTYVRREGLPFDNKGNTVSCLALKARGTVLENSGDGRRVKVDWEPLVKPREWYAYTGRETVWRLKQGDERADQLIRWAFFDEDQAIELFLDGGSAAGEPVPYAPESSGSTPTPYAVKDMLAEGIFIPESEIRFALRRLSEKRNLVLQGAPGVGKTFAAKRLAYAHLGERDASRVEVVQFHPSYSYEDFVRGYRPTDTAGRFELRDGPFVRLCHRAGGDPGRPYVLIIDEINRGNLSQVFGELFMLLDGDKRGREHALTPLYQRERDERFSVPENLYLIATMNIADRSLALVDFALRRRFAFLTLEPRFGDGAYRSWMLERGASADLVDRIVTRMESLNRKIAEDRRLGPAFRVGHSFFCPTGEDLGRLDATWFDEVVRSEIEPLLQEYWYDEPDKVEAALEEFRRRS